MSTEPATEPGADTNTDRRAHRDAPSPETIGLPLAGVNELHIEGDQMALTIRGDTALAGHVALDTGGGEHAPSLSTRGEVIALIQKGRHGPRFGQSPVLRVPLTGCPPIRGALDCGPITVRQVNAAVSLSTGADGLTLDSVTGAATLRTRSGGVTVLEHSGEVTVDTPSGGVRLTRCSGRATVNAASGGIHAEECQGMLRVNAGSGCVRVLRPREQDVVITAGSGGVLLDRGVLDGLTVTAGSGDVTSTANLRPAKTPYRVECGSGDVVFHLPTDVPLRVEATVKTGQVWSEIPLVSVGRPGPQSSAKRYVGVANELPRAALGGPDTPRVDVQIQSGRGNIDLLLAGSSAATRTSSTGNPAVPSATMRMTSGSGTIELQSPHGGAPVNVPVNVPVVAPVSVPVVIPPRATVPAGTPAAGTEGGAPAAVPAADLSARQDRQDRSAARSQRDADVQAILDALERREISVDEAEALLDRLG